MRFKTFFDYLFTLLVIASVVIAPLSHAKADKNQNSSKPSVEKHFNQKGQYTGKSVTSKNETKHYDSKGRYVGKSKTTSKKQSNTIAKAKRPGRRLSVNNEVKLHR